MMLRGCLAVSLAVSFCSTSQLTLAQQQVTPFGKASSAFNTKNYALAESLLTGQIEASSTDPRVYYLRGLARFELGRSDDARPDFAAGAQLEANESHRINIPRFLERIQGPGRRRLETYRSAAKRSASLTSNSARRSRTLYAMYSQARAAYFRSDLPTSQRLLDEVVRQGSQDPRVYYFRGLTFLKLGRAAEAQADFDQAVTMELNPGSRIDVDQALERVQGQYRRALETRREERLNVARAEQRQRRREMIAQLSVRGQAGSGLIATSVLPRTGTGGNPATPAVASTTTPPTATPTTPPAVKPVNPAGNGPAIDFRYLPPETSVLVRVNVREIWQSPLVRQYQDREELKLALAQMKQMTGLGPADIESITAGTTATTEELISGPGSATQGNADENAVVVVQTRLPFDVALLQKLPQFEAASHNGMDYFKPAQAAIDAGEDLPSICRAESKVLVLAREPALQKALDQDREAAPRPQFNFVDVSKQLLICIVPEDADALTSLLPDPARQSSGSPSLDQFVTAAKGHLLGASFSIGVDTFIELGFHFHCTDDASSRQMNTAFTGLLEEGKGLLSLATTAMPPQIGGLTDSFLRSVRSNSRSDTFTFSARITQQTISQAMAAVEELGPELLTGLAAGALNSAGSAGSSEPDKTIEPPPATAQAQNLSTTGSARISSTVEFDFDTNKELPRAIELLVDVTGDQAKNASGFGFVTLNSATDANGADLKLRQQQIDPFGGDGFETINRDDFFVKHPADGCRVTVKIEPPAKAAAKIAAVDGTVKLRIIDSASQVLVDDAKSLLGKNISSPELTQAGYALRLEESDEKFGDVVVKQWKLIWENVPADSRIREAHLASGGKGLQSPQLVDAQGKVIYTFDGKDPGLGGGKFSWSMAIQEDTPIPDGIRLQFTINEKVNIVDVPFKLTDIAIGKSEF